MPVLTGTSGWQYRHWRGVFYPRDVPQRQWLEYYASRFRTVENNGTFYRLPARDSFEQWRARTPDGFVMAVKASRYLSHIRRLRDPAEPVRRMLDAFAGLSDRLGPVLLQLPPNMQADDHLLDLTLGLFPADVRVAVEPRHPSWWTDRTREVLSTRGAALCWADRAGAAVTPMWRTADWGYLRFHEGTADPWPRYGARALRGWAERVAGTWQPDAPVYAYFNNDQEGAAVLDAADFARITEKQNPLCPERCQPALQGQPPPESTGRSISTRPPGSLPSTLSRSTTIATPRLRKSICRSRGCEFPKIAARAAGSSSTRARP
jgi:uncharacterized protein YecE (DUF72 family)